jgi:hypothetical protein
MRDAGLLVLAARPIMISGIIGKRVPPCAGIYFQN